MLCIYKHTCQHISLVKRQNCRNRLQFTQVKFEEMNSSPLMFQYYTYLRTMLIQIFILSWRYPNFFGRIQLFVWLITVILDFESYCSLPDMIVVMGLIYMSHSCVNDILTQAAVFSVMEYSHLPKYLCRIEVTVSIPVLFR